jgi:hypothetical protein
MHSSHDIGYSSAEVAPSSSGTLSNSASHASTPAAEQSFSHALASAIAHNVTTVGRTGQDAIAVEGGHALRQSPLVGAHRVGDKAGGEDFREATRLARWIASTPPFSLAATTSGHVQWQGRADISAFSADAQAKHGSRWHHELKPIGPVGET